MEYRGGIRSWNPEGSFIFAAGEGLGEGAAFVAVAHSKKEAVTKFAELAKLLRAAKRRAT